MTAHWTVGLVGTDWDLEAFAKHLDGEVTVSKSADGWELRAARFEELGDDEAIRQAASEMLVVITGLATIRDDTPDAVGLGNVRRYDDDGTKHVFATMNEHVRLRMRLEVAKNGIPSAPQSWQRDLDLAERDELVRAVIAFLSIAPATWHSLYSALEVIQKDTRTGRRAGLIGWGIASEAKLDRFTQTANSYRALGLSARHGPHFDPPRQGPMSIGDARELVRLVAARWIDELHGLGI